MTRHMIVWNKGHSFGKFISRKKKLYFRPKHVILMKLGVMKLNPRAFYPHEIIIFVVEWPKSMIFIGFSRHESYLTTQNIFTPLLA